jgi:hypothetical protein
MLVFLFIQQPLLAFEASEQELDALFEAQDPLAMVALLESQEAPLVITAFDAPFD